MSRPKRMATDIGNLPARRGKKRGGSPGVRIRTSGTPSRNRPLPLGRSPGHPAEGSPESSEGSPAAAPGAGSRAGGPIPRMIQVQSILLAGDGPGDSPSNFHDGALG